MMSHYIYKILDEALWRNAEEAGVFVGAGIDIADGFIHFSTAEQVKQTAHLHFAAQSGLLLLQIDTSTLDIIWEPSRGGQLFPHLYNVLDIRHVVRVWPLLVESDGLHSFPPLPD